MPFGKWKDFDDCVRDLTRQGRDADSARKICGTLQAQSGEESFSWIGNISPQEENLVRGKALHPIKTFHPQEWPTIRVYLEEELKKAAPTLSGKPLTLDHLCPIDGKVLSAQYEDGAIEYIAELNDDRVLDWVREGTIKHCSVEYDWSSLASVNGIAPKGLQFTGLALLKDFGPGDPETTVEVWEGIVQKLAKAKGGLSSNPREDSISEAQDATEREKLEQAQRERADKYGISPKEGGHFTKPEEYKNVPEHLFADPVNYRYPVDAEHVHGALAYFNQPDNRQAGGYTHDEVVKIMAKIVTAALDNGIEVLWQPDDPVYRDLPEELKKKLSGYEQKPIQEKRGQGEEKELDIEQLTQQVEELTLKSEEIQAQADALQAQINALQQALQTMVHAQTADGAPSARSQELEEPKREAEDLRNKVTLLTSQKKALERKVDELRGKLGDAIIDSSAEMQLPEDYVPKDAVIRELRKTVFERVPHHWGYGPYEQNRRIKVLMKRLERGSV